MYQQADLAYKLRAEQLPMQCPPIPWTSTQSGGYLVARSDFIRSSNSSNQLALIEERPDAELYPTLDSLNAIASIPWRINANILDIAVRLFKTINIQKPKKSYATNEEPDKVDNNKAEFATSQKLCEFLATMKRTRGELYYKLLVANHFRDKVFWFPHNIDFRGRIYPIPSILNYTDLDLNRSLLLFAQKKPLGPEGLKWLKLHCVNLRGDKKMYTLDERLEFADSSIDDILDSAGNPLTGRLWWLDSKEPWQTLACCLEISNAILSSDPENFLSGLYVTQDGTCNNLQHYAALSGNNTLAETVNLISSERPQDAYRKVADAVEKSRFEDAKNGNKIAEALGGYIERKLLKPPITIMMYGGGRHKVEEAIEKSLKKLSAFPQDLIKPAASYLAEKQNSSVPNIFPPAMQIQNWLRQCAEHITKQHQQNVQWITPLDWPVLHPYLTSEYDIGLTSDEEAIWKNMRAFAANFIHSLESSHMMLTSLNCQEAGITFISEHDSFGTHAASISTMNRICREQFFLLYSEPILENLSNFFIEKYAG